MKINIAIDASRNRSGGSISHLLGFLSAVNISKRNIEFVHLWSYSSLLDLIPDFSWLVKHYTPSLDGSLSRQLLWQMLSLSKEVKKYKCDILFTTDASTICRFSPMVVMSQDMLSYEPGVMRYFGYGLARLRLISILLIQNLAFRHASGVIFLSEYAKKVIQSSSGDLNRTNCIPHGINSDFIRTSPLKNWPGNQGANIRCIYISPVWEFKHQPNVVKAIEKLKNKGYSISLDLIGGGSKKAINILKEQILNSDPLGKYINYHGHIDNKKLPDYISNADIFIFASSCENLPITLLEGMQVGLPIACSNRGPMPEVLGDGGVYFDPEDILSITTAINEIILDKDKRDRISKISKNNAEQFSWDKNAQQTLSFIENILLEK
jgi:glycosyltransferase involved in cell wall biosynthesis